jgi:ribosomal protein S18 acetylase RimI-like enzyme
LIEQSFGKGSDGMQIRTATVADLALIAACADLAFAPIIGRSEKSDIKLKADSLRSQILEGSIRLICDAAHVLGYISLWPTADQMFIDTLAVLPKHRRQGLGSQLLAFADSETSRLGLSSVNLFTKAMMVNNLEFYRRRGFRETGRCDDDGFCRVFYTKEISPKSVVTSSRRRSQAARRRARDCDRQPS